MKKLLLLIFFANLAHVTLASHLTGGQISYKHIGGNTYEFTITYYRDCRPEDQGGGTPGALIEDTPIFVTIFDGSGNPIRNSSIQNDSLYLIEAYTDAFCAVSSNSGCYSKMVFKFNETLPVNSNGYYITTQRCCWVNGYANLNAVAANGMHTTTYISRENLQRANTSAIFSRNLNKVFCINTDQVLDCSATDANGDSLSYKFTHLFSGGGNSPSPTSGPNSPKPNPIPPPPYRYMNYETGYTYDKPLNISATNVSLDSITGKLYFTPTLIGNYHLGIACTEWRNGQSIQTNERNIIIRVEPCQKDVTAAAYPDVITPFNCPEKLRATGGGTYQWSILPAGQKTIYFDNDTIENPQILFQPNASQKYGEFKAVVEVSNSDGCKDTDTLNITISDDAYVFFPNAFTPNGDGRNDYFGAQLSGYTLENLKVFNRWGNLVFESNSQDKKWNGTYRAQKVALDSYYWVAILRDKQKNRVTKKGSVLVLR